MRSTRTLIVLTLALCAISARAQDPAANNVQQGHLLNQLQGLPAGFDLNLLRPQGVHGAVLNSVGNVADHVSNTAAGTVRTVGNVASGIGGAIGTVADVTAQTIRDIPSDIRGTLADTRESISQDFQTAREAAGMLGQFAQNTLPMIPPLHQAWNPAAWREQYSAYGSQFDNAYGALEGTLESIAEGISAKYCTEAVYVPKTKEPAEFTGPGFSITFLTGECSIDEKALLFDKTKTIDCLKPSVVYEKTPATFVAKYKASPEFYGKECKVTKSFGEEITKVLYVFDGSDNLPLANLTSRITSEVQDVLGGARAGAGAVTDQLQSFLASMPKIPGLMDGKIGNMNLIPNFDMPAFNLPNYGGASVQTPPVQAFEGAADPYEQLRAALGTYQTQ